MNWVGLPGLLNCDMMNGLVHLEFRFGVLEYFLCFFRFLATSLRNFKGGLLVVGGPPDGIGDKVVKANC